MCSYNNLRSVAGSNRVDTVETGLLWFPAFVFQNTKDKNESVVDNKATMEVVSRFVPLFLDSSLQRSWSSQHPREHGKQGDVPGHLEQPPLQPLLQPGV